jgi:hypothetical protein
MSSTNSTSDGHGYFQVIEEVFIRLRGAPLLLSPADWQLAQRWHSEGIPLRLVVEAIETVFATRQARGASGRVQGLRYCAPAVEKAWQERSELVASGERQEATPIDYAERLSWLAEELRATGFVSEQFIERVKQLVGSPESIEAGLVDLDSELIEKASRTLDEASLKGIRASNKESLTKLQSRLPEEEAVRVHERLFKEAIRRNLDLPVLSLFASRSARD